jgi:hypothetical protein
MKPITVALGICFLLAASPARQVSCSLSITLYRQAPPDWL